MAVHGLHVRMSRTIVAPVTHINIDDHCLSAPQCPENHGLAETTLMIHTTRIHRLSCRRLTLIELELRSTSLYHQLCYKTPSQNSHLYAHISSSPPRSLPLYWSISVWLPYAADPAERIRLKSQLSMPASLAREFGLSESMFLD